VSTMTAAAQGADSAVAAERNKLAQLRRLEEVLREEIDRSQQRERDLNAQLADVGRDALAQERRVADAEQMMADHAQALLQAMAGLELEPQPVPPNPLAMVQGQDAGSPMGDRVQQETTSTQAFPVQGEAGEGRE
jgi:hypothetical protein